MIVRINGTVVDCQVSNNFFKIKIIIIKYEKLKVESRRNLNLSNFQIQKLFKFLLTRFLSERAMIFEKKSKSCHESLSVHSLRVLIRTKWYSV